MSRFSLGVSSMADAAVLRTLRASALAAVIVLCGLAGHVTAGGASPSVPAVLVLFVAVAVLAGPMLGEPASVPRVVCLIVAGQGFAHVGLGWVAGAVPKTRMADSMLAFNEFSGSGPVAGTSGGHYALGHEHVLPWMSGADLAMLIGHLAAAIAVGLWLTAGERAVWTVLALTGSTVMTLLAGLLRAIDLTVSGLVFRESDEGPDWLSAVPPRAAGWDGYAASRRGPPRPASP